MMVRSNSAKVTVVLTRKQLELLERMSFLACGYPNEMEDDYGYSLEDITKIYDKLEDVLSKFDRNIDSTKNDLSEALDAYRNFTHNNCVLTSTGMYEMIMDVDKVKQQKFYLENLNYCISEYGKQQLEVSMADENVKFNGKLDSVYGILKTFVRDQVEGADFDQPGADAMRTLNLWWHKNKYKFRS